MSGFDMKQVVSFGVKEIVEAVKSLKVKLVTVRSSSERRKIKKSIARLLTQFNVIQNKK